jgi:hypothetical protein
MKALRAQQEFPGHEHGEIKTDLLDGLHTSEVS